MIASDSALVSRLRSGDQRAFAEVVRAWTPAMLHVAAFYVHSRASAEDVVQEAWLGVLRGLGGFAGRAQLRTWVFRILVNVAKTRGRVEARLTEGLAGPTVAGERFRGGDDPYPGHWLDERAPLDCTPESEVLSGEIRALFADALADLPVQQRTVVALRDVHCLDSAEVCELLGLTPANQRVLLHRGRTRLRQALEDALR